MPNTAKSEAIRKAWGIHYAEDIDENGWRESNVGSLGWDKEYFDIIKKDDNTYVIRPKSLDGISTNNGWIRIESEEDLPKDLTDAFLFDDDGDITQYTFGIDRKIDWDLVKTQGVTHFQPIVKPEKPIY